MEEEWIQTNVEDLSPQAHAEIRQREEREREERRAEEGTYEDMVYGMLLGFLLSVMMCFFMVRIVNHSTKRIYMFVDTMVHSGIRACRDGPSTASSLVLDATSRLGCFVCMPKTQRRRTAYTRQRYMVHTHSALFKLNKNAIQVLRVKEHHWLSVRTDLWLRIEHFDAPGLHLLNRRVDVINLRTDYVSKRICNRGLSHL